jgi:hypothetical protein
MGGERDLSPAKYVSICIYRVSTARPRPKASGSTPLGSSRPGEDCSGIIMLTAAKYVSSRFATFTFAASAPSSSANRQRRRARTLSYCAVHPRSAERDPRGSAVGRNGADPAGTVTRRSRRRRRSEGELSLHLNPNHLPRWVEPDWAFLHPKPAARAVPFCAEMTFLRTRPPGIPSATLRALQSSPSWGHHYHPF